MKTISVSELPKDLVHHLELVPSEDIVILKDGKPIGVLLSFNEDDAFDYQLEAHPLFLERVRRARKEFREGESFLIEDIRDELLREDTVA